LKDVTAEAQLNETIGKVLRYGVVVSSVVIAAGLVLMLTSPPPGEPGSLEVMLQSNFGLPTLSPSQLLRGIANGNSVSILELGTLILLATPLARVVTSVLLFLKERDSLYVRVTLLVLAMLLFAIFVIGPLEA
jgi:uncharacterized membrane protein